MALYATFWTQNSVYEVKKRDGDWALIYRGSVDAPAGERGIEIKVPNIARIRMDEPSSVYYSVEQWLVVASTGLDWNYGAEPVFVGPHGEGWRTTRINAIQVEEEESDDPTKIEIAYDPQLQRMSGVALHGNTPFDVPYISRITDDLWVGGCQHGMYLPEQIDRVLSLYTSEEYQLARHQVRVEHRLYDAGLPEIDAINTLADTVNQWRDEGRQVLVHCQAGLNRSALIAGLALVKREGMSGAEAIDLLREKRSPACLCNAEFASWLARQ